MMKNTKTKPGSIPTKTYDKIKEEMVKFFESRHNVCFKNLGPLPTSVIKIVCDEMHAPLVKKKGNLKKFCSTWFSLTNIRGAMEEHSAHGFVLFMEKHYDVVVVTKNKSIIKNILIWALKLVDRRNLKQVKKHL